MPDNTPQGAGAATTVKDGATPSSTPSAPAAPVTAVDALRGAEARLSQPDSSSGTGDQPPAATTPPPVVPPAGAAGNVQPQESEGIRQLRSAYEDLKTKTGWAASLNQTEVREAMGFFQDFMRNPVAVIREVMRDPDLGGLIAPMLQPPPQDPEPQPDLQTADGKYRVYSAEQQQKWRQWNDRQQKQQLDNTLAPLTDYVDRQQRQEYVREVRAKARETTERVMAEMRQMPHFTEANEPEIEKRLRAISPHVRKEIGAIGCLQMAYNQFLKEVVFPKVDEEADKRAAKRASEKAAAGTGGVRPAGGPVPQITNRPKNPAELAAHMRTMAEKQG